MEQCGIVPPQETFSNWTNPGDPVFISHFLLLPIYFLSYEAFRILFGNDAIHIPHKQLQLNQLKNKKEVN